MVKVLTITITIVLLLLVVVLLLSLLVYQDHYSEAAVESCHEDKALFEYEQNTAQNRPATICIIFIIIIIIVTIFSLLILFL